MKTDFMDIWIDGVNWVRQAQNTVQLRAFVNMVMNLRVALKKQAIFDKLSNY